MSSCHTRDLAEPATARLKPASHLLFLLIEFFDELLYGVEIAALPVLRAEIGLTYAQVGVLLGLPAVVNLFIEPVLLLLGDTRWRKTLMVCGGLALSAAVALVATAQSFWPLVLAFVLAYPASGAFVTLAQASLMDRNPGREPQMMARWTFVGSLGDLLGPLLLAAGLALGTGWRWAFAGLASTGLCLAAALSLLRAVGGSRDASTHADLLEGLKVTVRPNVLRWIGLLKISDLMLDILLGYAALYLTDVIGLEPARASLVMAGLMAAGLISDVAVIPLLERLHGRALVRASAALALVLFSAVLLVPYPQAKVAFLLLTRLSTLGWYPVLQGEAYAAAQGRSGTVMAVSSAAGFVDGGLAWAIGWIASVAGLPWAMAFMLLAPVGLLMLVPRRGRGVE